MIIINCWYGRLGNNIIQLINAISIAIKKKHHKISFPSHNMLTNNFIKIEDILEINENKNLESYFFDNDPYFIQLNISINADESRRITLKYIKPILKLNNEFKEFCKSELLGIHIRSGDIFISTPHNLYVQPPYYYYKKIMNLYEKIVVIYENKGNPCINKILNDNSIYKNQSSNLIDDLSLLLNCENVCLGFGTFGNLVWYFSEVVKKIYMPDYFYNYFPKNYFDNLNIEIIVINIPNYIKVGEWKNTPQQQELMLNYKFE